MKKLYTIIVLIFLLIIAFSFYWFEYRPVKIRKDCNIKAQGTLTKSLSEFVAVQSNYDNNYKKCLRENGIEK